MTATALPDMLVSAEWLVDHLHDPSIRVVDIRGYVETVDHGDGRQSATYRGAPEEYASGHIPGAVYVDWTADIVDPDAEVKAQVAPPELFASRMSDLGIGNETDVVISDHAGGHFATRLWWALRYYGHPRAAVLDGGYRRWNALGLPLETARATYPQEQFRPLIDLRLVSDASTVLGVVERGDRQLVDARDPGQFAGTVQRGSRGGHIPGALNLSARELFADDGRWKSPEEIAALAGEHGVDVDSPVTAYCNGGVTATAVLFGLYRAGLRDISNYDGSWNEWGERSELPVEGDHDLWSDRSE